VILSPIVALYRRTIPQDHIRDLQAPIVIE